jgi:hypothetical protein
MLALLAGEVQGRWRWAIGLAAAWLLVQGPPPLPTRIDLVVSGVGQAVLVAICTWAILRRSPMPMSATETPAALPVVDRALVRA